MRVEPSRNSEPKLLPRNRLGLIEVFAGIGSVARGFSENGVYETLLLNDIDPHAKAVYLSHAGPDAKYVDMDIRQLRYGAISKHVDGNNVIGLLGCPPCQGFSEAGPRQESDPRNRLVNSYFRLIDQMQPNFFVMENVERLLQYKAFQKKLQSARAQYNVWTGVLNSALYGVPQTRTRAIVIGYHRDTGVIPTLPLPTHLGCVPVFDYGSQKFVDPSTKEGIISLGLLGDVRVDWSNELPAYLLSHGKKLNKLVTLQDALGDLPEAVEGGEPQSYKNEGSAYAKILRKGASHAFDHEPWNHRPETIRRLKDIPEGGVLLGDGVRGRSRRYFSQAYSKLHRDGISRTITTNFHNPGSGRFLHYDKVRTLTLREAARLQGIPDSVRFNIVKTDAERLIGNAFPQPLARVISDHISKQLGHAGAIE